MEWICSWPTTIAMLCQQHKKLRLNHTARKMPHNSWKCQTTIFHNRWSLSLKTWLQESHPKYEALSPVKKSTTKTVGSLTRMYILIMESDVLAAIFPLKWKRSLLNFKNSRGTACFGVIAEPACSFLVNFRYSFTSECERGFVELTQPILL